MEEAPDYDRSQWLSEKFKLVLDFPNLLYLIDGAHRITQSNAIVCYITRKHNLSGETEEEKIRVDILENQAMDTANQLGRVCYSPDFEKLKPYYLKGLPEMVKRYSQFLGKRPWFAGDKSKLLKRNFLVDHALVIVDSPLWSKKTRAMAMTLGYWDIRGLAHAIRLLLEYTDSHYEEKMYSIGDAPDYDRSQWLSEKFKLGLDFPNLPYLIDGAHRITQSNAIVRYIARKHNLCGETEEERIRVDLLENQVMDIRIHLGRICYSPDFEKLKPELLEGLPEKMKQLSLFLGKRPWFAGDKITYVDFLAYDVLDLHRIFEPTCLDAFPNLKEFMTRFEGLQNISAYMKSSRFLPCPLFSKMAVWGNK